MTGIDFPFGQARQLIDDLGWPAIWDGYVGYASALGRVGFRVVLDAYRAGQPLWLAPRGGFFGLLARLGRNFYTVARRCSRPIGVRWRSGRGGLPHGKRNCECECYAFFASPSSARAQKTAPA